MKPPASARVVHPLDNPTAIASRLRWLAKQLMNEGGRPDQRSARPNLYGAARQLQEIANAAAGQYGDEIDWIKSGCNILAVAIAERVTDLAIDEVLHG